jgi:hypothetical protein
MYHYGSRTGGKPHQLFQDEASTVLFKDPGRTAQYTFFISFIKANHFLLDRAKIAVFSEI